MNFLNKLFAIFGVRLVKLPVKRNKRICQLCGKAIPRTSRRWHYVDGVPQHWFCEAPEVVPIDLDKIKGAMPESESKYDI